MGIFDEIRERRELKSASTDYENSVNEAQKTFDSQVDAIKAIQHTDGFHEIIKYFERDSENCKVLLLRSGNTDEIKAVQLRYSIVENFMSFLTSRIDYTRDVEIDNNYDDVEQL